MSAPGKRARTLGRQASLVHEASFNPVHKGYFQTAALAVSELERRGFNVVKVVFVPRHRKHLLMEGLHLMTDEHRFESLRLACAGSDWIPHCYPCEAYVEDDVPSDVCFKMISVEVALESREILQQPVVILCPQNQREELQQILAEEEIADNRFPGLVIVQHEENLELISDCICSELKQDGDQMVHEFCPSTTAKYLIAHRKEIFSERCWQCGCIFSIPHEQGRYRSGWHQPVGGTGWRGPEWYCRACWSSWRATCVVGITGVTRAGKSTLAEGVCNVLNDLVNDSMSCEVVHQDFHRKFGDTWIRQDGFRLTNWETPERCDWSSLLVSIEEAAARSCVVLVEGFCILSDDRVQGILDQVVWLQLDEATCRRRRDIWPSDWAHKDAYFDACIWPAHKRYEESLFMKPSYQNGVPTALPTLSQLNGSDPQDELIETLVERIRGWIGERDIATPKRQTA